MDQKQIELTQKMIQRAEMFEELTKELETTSISAHQVIGKKQNFDACTADCCLRRKDLLQRAKSLL